MIEPFDTVPLILIGVLFVLAFFAAIWPIDHY